MIVFSVNFNNEKKQCLSKTDRSKKQSIDALVKRLCAVLNRHPDYYTTSSCSGRTVLIEKQGFAKQKARWLYVTHGSPLYGMVKKAITQPFKGELWFVYEPLILHVACSSMDAAHNLLSVARAQGLKRSGLITFHNRILMEIIGTEHIDAIVGKNGKLLATDDLLKELTVQGRVRHKRNVANIKKLMHAVQDIS